MTARWLPLTAEGPTVEVQDLPTDCGPAIAFVNENFQGDFHAGERPARVLVRLLGELLEARKILRPAQGEVRRVCNDCDEEVQADNSCGCPLEEAAEAEPAASTLEQRLFAARQASGLPLGELICLAFGSETLGDEDEESPFVALHDSSDDALVDRVERRVREHPRGEGR